MHFDLYFEHPQEHLIRIQTTLPPSGEESVSLRLSLWRPGRYEVAPYAENIADMKAWTPEGPLGVLRRETHCWEIFPSGNLPITVEYKYYAVVKDAGGSCFDDEQVYLNGINLFLFGEDDLDRPHSFQLHLPNDWVIGCGLRRSGSVFHANSWHDLTDAPVLASPTLQHRNFDVRGIPFHIWMQGRVLPDWDRLERDFRAFSERQIDLFGAFPVSEYHFLFQVHDGAFYHGVEHHNSTIIAIGPGSKWREKEIFDDVLGVSSHELFHTWNVKAIRPDDMLPYSYDRLNYSRLHYVTEGVTTYYGDLMLLRGRVWNLKEYLENWNGDLFKKWCANEGGNYISLEEASFDSWVNGYKNVIPNRKISFYTKGALVAFLLDVRLRAATRNQQSLDDVMRGLWERFGKRGLGYKREDYLGLIGEILGETGATEFAGDFISGLRSLEEPLRAAGDYLGLHLVLDQGSLTRKMGLTVEEEALFSITQIWEDLPASRAGLSKDDQLVAVNGIRIQKGNFSSLLAMAREMGNQIHLHVFRGSRLMEFHLATEGWGGNPQYLFVENKEATPDQLANRKAWMGEA